MTSSLRLAILGAGGLGKGMLARVDKTPDFEAVAIVDRHAYCYESDGISSASFANVESVAARSGSIPSPQPVLDLFKTHGDEIDVVFVALPNLPVDFIPDLMSRIVQETHFRGVMVDALKRTKAVEAILKRDALFRERGVLYITGAGATPGFLSTIAAVAAQSFVEVVHIDIYFGVGVANWQTYRATIREDFLHLDGFDADRVAAMTDADIEAELDARNGLLELVNMEHADDIILERAGICRREQVTVGGMVDTRHAQKPVSTRVTITGKTTAGEIARHVLTLDDATTMVDNVCGPALGFLRQGMHGFRQGQVGVVTSAELMPRGPLAISAPVVSVPL
jgi:hypothetical protein